MESDKNFITQNGLHQTHNERLINPHMVPGEIQFRGPIPGVGPPRGMLQHGMADPTPCINKYNTPRYMTVLDRDKNGATGRLHEEFVGGTTTKG